MEIVLENLTKDYGNFRSLDKVNLKICGGMFGLLGPNGAGKTTMMRILATLLLPTDGKVEIGGFDVLREGASIRKRLGYLPQDFGFYPNLKVFQMLEYIAILKNIPPNQRREQVDNVLEAVNLMGEAHRRVGTLSGGMRQRLGIAQALLGKPDLLIIDEPTGGLDPEERIRFRNLLAQLSKRTTVLLSTHIVADVEFCTGLAVLDRGRLIFVGNPADLAARAHNLVWQVEVPIEHWSEVDRRYTVLATQMVQGKVQARLLTSNPPLADAQPIVPRLEDGYVAVIQNNHTQRGVRHA